MCIQTLHLFVIHLRSRVQIFWKDTKITFSIIVRLTMRDEIPPFPHLRKYQFFFWRHGKNVFVVIETIQTIFYFKFVIMVPTCFLAYLEMYHSIVKI